MGYFYSAVGVGHWRQLRTWRRKILIECLSRDFWGYHRLAVQQIWEVHGRPAIMRPHFIQGWKYYGMILMHEPSASSEEVVLLCKMVWDKRCKRIILERSFANEKCCFNLTNLVFKEVNYGCLFTIVLLLMVTFKMRRATKFIYRPLWISRWKKDSPVKLAY